MTVLINNIEYSYKNADVNYQVGNDVVINITLDTTLTVSEIIQIMNNYTDVTIVLDGDTYEHLSFMSVSKRYPKQESMGGIQVVFVNEDNELLTENN